MPTILERAQRAWDVLRGKDSTSEGSIFYYGSSSSYRPDRHRYGRSTERSIMAPLLNRIAVDASTVSIRHVQLDDKNRYAGDVEDELNDVFNLSANIDQTGRAFLKDVYASMLDEGVVAIVPVDGTVNEQMTSVLTVRDVRVGKIVNWLPRHVEIEIYNDRTGQHDRVTVSKNLVAICENPFYAIMNESNSVAQRLRRKLALLDQLDEKTASGKLDLIIQLPYTTRSETRKKQAEERKKEIEVQLAGSKYGVAYTDASEKIIQLNRSLDNNLVPQIERLEKQLMDQLGIGEEILSGKADEQQLMNYTSNIIEPIVSAVVTEVKRKFLTRNARTRGESVMFFRDPFRLTPVGKIAEIAGTFRQAEILSSNEIRAVLGYEPSDDEDAERLANPNINQAGQGTGGETPTEEEPYPEGEYNESDF